MITKNDDISAKWRFESAPTPRDEMAVGCELVSGDGDVLAACLWSGGELDIDSDGCGVFNGSHADDIDWPDEDEAISSVWGCEG